MRLDPEDLRTLTTQCRHHCSRIIESYHGYAACNHDARIIGYFGFPSAGEHDAENAVRAALAIIGSTGALRTMCGGHLECRIGIATGLVVVEESTVSISDCLVIGEPPALAGWLQGVADPDTLVIAQTTRQLVGGLFECRDLGRLTLPGLAEPVQAWQVLAASAAARRFDALRPNMLPLVGRGEEIDLLLRRWQQARGGEGCVVLLSGEAGVGKSRLCAALDERLTGETPLRLHWDCSPHYQDSALHPVISELKRHAGIQDGDDTVAEHARLEAFLARNASSPEEIALIADLLGLSTGAEPRVTEFSPQRRRTSTIRAIIRHFENCARAQPVLAMFEDLHWADPTSLELLQHLVEIIERLPMLLVVTGRSEIRPGWIGRPQVSALLLNRLGRREVAALIDRVAAGRRLPGPVREQIIAHSDGVPLFAEELAKAAIESGLTEASVHLPGSGPRPSPLVPISLQASLTSRLDRLVRGKEIAQMAAVIGREFSQETFLSVFGLPSDLVAGGLQALVEADILVQRGEPPYAVYGFKHALIQDAAYALLLRERRRTLHQQVAEKLKSEAAEECELLAYHFAEAGLADHAVDCYIKAAAQAGAHCAITEMVNHVRRGFQLLSVLYDTPATRRRELALQTALGRGLAEIDGSGSHEAYVANARAREICLELNETEQLLPILYGLQVYHYTRAEPDMVMCFGQEIRSLGARTGDRRAVLMGERVSGSAHLQLGNFGAARTAYENLIRLYDPIEDAGTVNDVTRDPMVAGCGFLSLCLTVMGYPTQGLAAAERGIAHAEALGHRISAAFSLRRGCTSAMLRRDAEAVRRMAARLVELSADDDTLIDGAEGQFWQCWGLLHISNSPALEQQLHDSLNRLDEAGMWARLSYFMAAAAELTGELGNHDGARTLLARAAELVGRTGEVWCLPEITRLRARYTATDSGESELMLHEAIALAREQQAKLWDLRAAMDLALLLRRRGAHEDAQMLLEPVLAWWTEGSALPDLVAARALLSGDAPAA
jgi:class 3 adenylate cyclase/tetratricopeptide (TPR) repeat protein